VSPQVPPDLRQALESLLRDFLRVQSATESTDRNLLPQSIDESGQGQGKQVFGSAVALVGWRTLECYGLKATDYHRTEEARLYARDIVDRLINSSPGILEIPCTEAAQKPLEGYLGWAGLCMAAATLGVRLRPD